MPGCGKSTIGKLLAEKLNRKCIDADAEIEKLTGKTIPEIFAQQGEDAFRALETQVLAQFGKQSSLVIATGGGCVTRPENYRHLHQNGSIFWIKREVSHLPTNGRPLSAKGNLDEMYRIRKPLYKRFADAQVANTTCQAAANEIIQILRELT
jgi:shikimate dehydrogenase